MDGLHRPPGLPFLWAQETEEVVLGPKFHGEEA